MSHSPWLEAVKVGMDTICMCGGTGIPSTLRQCRLRDCEFDSHHMHQFAPVMELADIRVLEARDESHAGSTPVWSTNLASSYSG